MKKRSLKKILLDVLILSAGCIIPALGVPVMLMPNSLYGTEILGIAIVIAELIEKNYVMIFCTTALVIIIATFAFLGKTEGFKIILLSIIFPVVLVFLKFCIWNL